MKEKNRTEQNRTLFLSDCITQYMRHLNTDQHTKMKMRSARTVYRDLNLLRIIEMNLLSCSNNLTFLDDIIF